MEPRTAAESGRRFQRIAVIGVSVVSMNRPGVLKDRTVVIEDGVIREIEHVGNISTEGMWEVDGRGKYLMPGLSDMHVHLWMPGDAALFLANGVTTVRNMSGAPFHLALKNKQNSGQAPGPRIVTTGPIIDDDEFMLPMWQRLSDPAKADEVVRGLVRRGYDQVKVLNMVSPEVLAALGNASRRYGLRLVGHCPLGMSYEQAMDAGMTCFEHLVGIWRGHFLPGVAPAGPGNLALDVVEAVGSGMDRDALRRLAGRMAQQGVWNCPTLVTARDMLLPFEEGLEKQADRMRFVPRVVFPLWKQLDSNRRYAGDPEMFNRWRTLLEQRAAALEQVTRLLHEEGAPLLTGTDTSVRFVVQGFSLHDELGLLVRSGIPIFDVLRTATVAAAEFLDWPEKFGAVRTGYRADLLLLDANPLSDLQALKQISAVFANGYFYDRQVLDSVLAHQAEAAGQQPPALLPEIGRTQDPPDGSWKIYDGDRPVGSGSFRHRKLNAGGWEIRETVAFEQPSIFLPAVTRRYTTLRLNGDQSVRSLDVFQENYAGQSRLRVRVQPNRRYLVTYSAEDGTIERTTLLSDRLQPDPVLAVSLLEVPAYADRLRDAEIELLGCRFDAMDGRFTARLWRFLREDGLLTALSPGDVAFKVRFTAGGKPVEMILDGLLYSFCED